MSIVKILLLLLALFIAGCSAAYPPWSERELSRMEMHDIDSVPIMMKEF